MKVREAIALGRKWVEEAGPAIPGFAGAYLAGSLNDMDKDAPFDSFRDVDVYVVVEDPALFPQKKFTYEGVLLESVPMSLAEHRSSEATLSAVHAGSVASCEILADPTGLLHELRKTVAAEYAEPRWVAARCEGQKQQLAYLFTQVAAAPEPLFLLGFVVLYLGNIITLASVRTPTVRRLLALTREVLEARGRLDLQEELLGVMGSARMDRDEVVSHLENCVAAFDRAVEVTATPFYTSWNLHAGTRPYLVEGAREMIDAGEHREAMFFIAMMHTIANMAIQIDAPEQEKAAYQESMARLRAALGVGTAEDWEARLALARGVSERVIQFAG